jgi:hypothetical protein
VAGLLVGRMGKRPAQYLVMVVNVPGQLVLAHLGCSATGDRPEQSAYSVSMPKTPRVVSIRKTPNKAKLIAKDAEGQRIIIGIGRQRIAYDFYTRITHRLLRPEANPRRSFR